MTSDEVSRKSSEYLGDNQVFRRGSHRINGKPSFEND